MKHACMKELGPRRSDLIGEGVGGSNSRSGSSSSSSSRKGTVSKKVKKSSSCLRGGCA
jgi:hypothetical protein